MYAEDRVLAPHVGALHAGASEVGSLNVQEVVPQLQSGPIYGGLARAPH